MNREERRRHERASRKIERQFEKERVRREEAEVLPDEVLRAARVGSDQLLNGLRYLAVSGHLERARRKYLDRHDELPSDMGERLRVLAEMEESLRPFVAALKEPAVMAGVIAVLPDGETKDVIVEILTPAMEGEVA